MFVQQFREEQKPDSVYGLVQTGQETPDKTIYQTFYVRCKINVFNKDEVHQLNCSVVHTTSFTMGRITLMSQMYDSEERRVAIVFDSQPDTVYVYFFWPDGFGFYGRKDYAGDVGNRVTGIDIANGKLFVVLEYSKRMDIFKLEDLHESSDIPVNAKPRMTINSDYMRFFGVDYFAPVNLKVSRFHKEAIFLKTKTGIMVMNLNEDCIGQLLFKVDTLNGVYDFQVNHDHLLILNSTDSSLYDLDIPLRRQRPPYLRQDIKQGFHLG